MTETTLIRDAVFNAVINANRKKGKPFKKLWQKKAQKVDKQKRADTKKLILEIEKKDTERGWVKRIQEAAGIFIKRGKGD